MIDAKIASFDRQDHRQKSQTFQSHKQSLKLMQMSKPQASDSSICWQFRPMSRLTFNTGDLKHMRFAFEGVLSARRLCYCSNVHQAEAGHERITDSP
jgi:hypothetical protein